MKGRLQDKIVLITGTSGGQGRAAAVLFAREGAVVVGCDLKEEDNGHTWQLVEEAGGRMDAQTLDITQPDMARHWVEEAARRYGRLDVVYNNAALELFAPFPRMRFEEDWHYTLRYELDGIFLVTQAAWPSLQVRGGSIINTASVSGMRANEHIGSLAHAAGKGAVIALTRQLALEGAPHGIRANSISPGPIDTPVTLSAKEQDPGFGLTYEGWPLLHRVGQPEDIAYCALWLASDESAFVTGINVPVDGGWSAKGGFTAKAGPLQENQRPQ
jgi:NAD(P)-dependent dehydrogenase (short-subunit alcohol dehydrogenase family)